MELTQQVIQSVSADLWDFWNMQAKLILTRRRVSERV
jgi:hypothetical protein